MLRGRINLLHIRFVISLTAKLHFIANVPSDCYLQRFRLHHSHTKKMFIRFSDRVKLRMISNDHQVQGMAKYLQIFIVLELSHLAQPPASCGEH